MSDRTDLSPLVEDFLAECRRRGVRPTTRRLYRYQVTATARRLGVPLEQATPERLAAVFDGWDLTDRARHTAKLTVRGFYRWAAEEGRIDGNPAWDLIPANPVPRRLEQRDGPSLYELARAHLEERRSTGEITALTARSALQSLAGLCDLHGPRPAAALAPATLEAWLRSMGRLAPATRRTRWSAARVFCRWLVMNGHVGEDPTLRFKAPKVPRAVHRALDGDQAAALLAVCPDERARCVVLLALQLGLRRAEIAGLELGDLSFTGRTLLVRHGKGGHQRLLPLTGQATEAISGYLAAHPAKAGPLIRGDRYPRQGVSPAWVGRLVTDLAWSAGIKAERNDGVSTHALRHTAASDTYVASRDVLVVRDMLGHVSLATTATYVRGLDVDRLRYAMEGRRYGDGSR